MNMTSYGFLIDDRIYWTLWYSTCLHFTIHNHTGARTNARAHAHTHTHTQVSTVTSSLAVAGQRLPTADILLPLGFLSPTWGTSFSQQKLTTEPQRFSKSLIYWLTQSLTNLLTQLNWLSLTNCIAYKISARITQKTPVLCYCLRAVA
jgi:hypothetical protein